MNSANPFNLDGHTVLITGASSGIGRAVAIQASLLGARCAITGRNGEHLQETLHSMHGSAHCLIQAELSEDSIENIVPQAVLKLGKFSGFVHCAGIEKTLPFRSTTLEDFRLIMWINVEAFVLLAQQLLMPANRISHGFSAVGISSVAGLYGAAAQTAYSASKGALVSLIKSLACEYAPKKIRFNCLCPGYVNTPMLEGVQSLYRDKEAFKQAIVARHPLGLGNPEDIANAAAYLLSDASQWMTGSVVQIDGGYGVN